MGRLPAPSARADQAQKPQRSAGRRVGVSAPVGWAGLLALISICAALVALAHTRAAPLDLGVATERLVGPAFTDGIYALERGPDGRAFRWTSGSAMVQLRGAASVAPTFLLTARLRAENPAGPQILAFLSDGRPLAMTNPAPTYRVYRLLLRPATDGELRMSLRTPTFVAPGNPRALGVALTDLKIRPLPTLDWPGATVTAIGLLILAVFLRRTGTSLGQSFAAVALAGLGLATVAATYRPAPLPFAALAALFLLATLVGEAGLMQSRWGCTPDLAFGWFLAAKPPKTNQKRSFGGGFATPKPPPEATLQPPLVGETWRGTNPLHENTLLPSFFSGDYAGALPRLGMIALALIVSFSGVIWPSWLSDDAFISFRYAQNLAAGNGLVYNLGEQVEGYTNFLWTIIAAGVLALGGDIVIWSYLSGVGLGLAILLLTYAIAARLRGPAWGLVAALVVGTSQSLLLYTARGAGLETGFFTLLVMVGGACYLFARRRPLALAAAGAALALAAMTRPEGVLVFGVTLIADCRLVVADWGQSRSRSWRVNLRSAITHLQSLAGAFLLIFLPYYLWRLSYYGDPLPNTFYAKTGGGLRQVLRGLEYAGGFALTLGGPLLLLPLLPWLRGWRAAMRSWRGYLLPLALVYSAYIVAVGGDHFRGERFFVPVLPWLAMLLADGLAAALPQRPSRLAPALLALLLTCGGAAALARSAASAETISGVDESVWIWREIGWWLADHAPPDASLAALGAGAVAYYGQHPVIDLLGLTEKHIARITVADMGEGTAGHEKRDPAYVLRDRRPTYIPQIWDDYFGGAAGLRARYRLITIVTRSGRELRMWERIP
ncbi:MAG: hypothetical protein WCJ55_17735 [Chloroflexales bacterium]